MIRPVLSLFFTTLIYLNPLAAQWITHGPAIGAVTDHSARMYVRTEHKHQLVLEYYPEGLVDPIRLLTDSTRAYYDNSLIFDLENLRPDTRYYYQFYVDGQADTSHGHFRTFPSPDDTGTFTFVTGSCQETDNMKVFEVIPKHGPYFLLHTGDYTYPDYQIKPDYSADYELVALSYQKRYNEKVMKEMLRYIPIDYVYDDNDYVGGSGGRYYKNYNENYSKLGFKVNNTFSSERFPDFWRRNCIKGYTDFFPGYPMVDTGAGIFHSFRFGNAEFFFLDRCSANEHPNSYAFEYDEKHNRYYFNPPDDHRLFGETQMNWLKNGLQNSDADWKFIVSGVPLNRSVEKLITAGLQFQKMGWENNNGFRQAAGFSHYWAGHRAEITEFYQWLDSVQVPNIIAISGDTHHNVMDDGCNAGIPEMNASGLSVDGTYLSFALNMIGKVTGLYKYKKDVWNQGGLGVGNRDFKNAFGKVTIVNDEYVELSLINEDDEVVSSFKVYHSTHSNYLDLFEYRAKQKGR